MVRYLPLCRRPAALSFFREPENLSSIIALLQNQMLSIRLSHRRSPGTRAPNHHHSRHRLISSSLICSSAPCMLPFWRLVSTGLVFGSGPPWFLNRKVACQFSGVGNSSEVVEPPGITPSLYSLESIYT